jgi:CRISPR type I-D-associated protein Csc2
MTKKGGERVTYSLEFVPEKLKQHLLSEPSILKQPNVIQIFLLRQTHDYSIFRTEETRELNVAILPKAINDMEPTTRIAMLPSKQKAPENRQFNLLVRSFAQEHKLLNKEQQRCELKDNLCMSCPRCILFGAVSTETRRATSRWNIKHRVEYSTAYSLEPWEEISEITTFNAVSTVTQSTGQALGYVESVSPLANFPSIVTLTAITAEELIAFLKTLMTCKSYGAETRTKGDMVNVIVGIAAGYEELLTPLEYNLELCNRDYKEDPVQATYEIVKKYRQFAAFENKVATLDPEEFRIFIENVRKFDFTEDFIQKMYKDSTNFVAQVERWAAEESRK